MLTFGFHRYPIPPVNYDAGSIADRKIPVFMRTKFFHFIIEPIFLRRVSRKNE